MQRKMLKLSFSISLIHISKVTSEEPKQKKKKKKPSKKPNKPPKIVSRKVFSACFKTVYMDV